MYAPNISASIITIIVIRFFTHLPSIMYIATVTPALKCPPPILPVRIAAMNRERPTTPTFPFEKLMPRRKIAVPMNS